MRRRPKSLLLVMLLSGPAAIPMLFMYSLLKLNYLEFEMPGSILKQLFQGQSSCSECNQPAVLSEAFQAWKQSVLSLKHFRVSGRTYLQLTSPNRSWFRWRRRRRKTIRGMLMALNLLLPEPNGFIQELNSSGEKYFNKTIRELSYSLPVSFLEELVCR